MGTTTSVKIDTALLDKLHDYRKLSGVSVTYSINEALTDYVGIVIPARIEMLRSSRVSQNEKRATKKRITLQ